MRIGFVAAHIDVAAAAAVVVDMAKQIAPRVLRHRRAKIGPDTQKISPTSSSL